MKLKLFFLTALAFLFFPLSAQAIESSPFSIRLGQPKSPTNQNNFKLTFVALDTRDDRSITVRCFKKGPSDGSFTQFDTDKVMIPGGNTDSCNITDSILNTNGSYSFYVTAEASSITQTSSTVVVDYNTSGPSTPNSYSKERLNSCDYKIKFRTADDGKTAKVQLFRSDTLNIPVGSSAVITELNIAPNTAGEITNSTPNCGKDYYYVIRAVDSADNASGVVGDSFTTTTIVGSTTSGANGTTGTGAAGSGAIAINGANSQVTSPVDGKVDKQGENASGSATDTTTSPTPSVLGTSTDKNKTIYKVLTVVTAALALFFTTKSFKKSKSK